jgi:hypothetical protein
VVSSLLGESGCKLLVHATGVGVQTSHQANLHPPKPHLITAKSDWNFVDGLGKRGTESNAGNCSVSCRWRWLASLRPGARHAFTALAQDDEGDGGEGGYEGEEGPSPATRGSVLPPSRPQGRWCPEEQAGLLSRLFFSYCEPLLALGSSKHLESSDLWDTSRRDVAAPVSEEFEWQLVAADGRVLRALWRTYRRPFIVAGAIKLAHDCVMFTGPWVLGLLLTHLESGCVWCRRVVGVGVFMWVCG